MNIDLWESAAVLWAGWLRGCTIVQQNWRFPGEIPPPDSLAARFYAEADAAYALDAESFEQFLNSSELDVLGLCLHEDGRIREMVVAEASANQYPSIHKTMLKKFLRAVVCCLSVAPASGMSITLSFIGPNLSDYAIAEVQKAAKLVLDFCEKHEGLLQAGIRVQVGALFLGAMGMWALSELLCIHAPKGGVGNRSNPFAQALNLYRCCHEGRGKTLPASEPEDIPPPVPSPDPAAEEPSAPAAEQEPPSRSTKVIRNEIRRHLKALSDEGLLTRNVCDNLCSPDFCRKEFGLYHPLLRDIGEISGDSEAAQLYNAMCRIEETGFAVLLNIPQEAADAVLRWADARCTTVPELRKELYRELTKALADERDLTLCSNLCNPLYCSKHLQLEESLLKPDTLKARSMGIYDPSVMLRVRQKEYLILIDLPGDILSRLQPLLHPNPSVDEQAEFTPDENPKPTTKAAVFASIKPMLTECHDIQTLCDVDICRSFFGVSHPILCPADEIQGSQSCLYYKERLLLHGAEFRLYSRLTENACSFLVSYLSSKPFHLDLTLSDLRK